MNWENRVNKQTVKGFKTITAASQTFRITDGTQITPTPGPPAMGAMLNVWAASSQVAATIDIVIGSTSVGVDLVPNYRAEETPTGGTGNTILDFAGTRINEDQIIADQLIGPSVPISIVIKGNAGTSGRVDYLVVMEPIYADGTAVA